jgi:protein-tyrosine phosphatase
MNLLFLCTGNYYRSRFAEEYFNAQARAKGLLHRAFSRGLAENFERLKNPGPMSAHALLELQKCGIAVQTPIRKPQKLSGAEVGFFDMIICMDKKEHWPMVKRRLSLKDRTVIYWKIKDLCEQPASKALPECRQQIDALIQKLAKPAKPENGY